MSDIQTQRKQRTITLTDRRPVHLYEDEWPVIAEASYHDYEGQYDFQSFRHWRGWLKTRQHEDGRVIVSATYSYETAYQGERDSRVCAGYLLDAASTDQIVAAIHRANEIRPEWCSDDLAARCIADLPAEQL